MSPDLAATQLLDPGVIEDPYPFYRRLLAAAPVWRVPGTRVVAVSSSELVNEATARVDDFSSNMRCLLYKNDAGLPEQLSFGEFAQQTLATADPPRHALHRKAVFPELVARRMLMLEPEISRLAVDCVGRAVAAGRTDFMAVVGNVIPITVINSLVGFTESDIDVLLRAAFDSTAMLGSVVSRRRLEELIASTGDVEEWISDQIAAAPTGYGNILSSIVRAIADGTFLVEEGTIILHTLLSAGGETTSSLLGNAILMLAERPDLQRQLRADPGLVASFVEEVLRLESPFRMMMRSVPAPTTLGGVKIAAGDTVLLMYGAANRDPAQYHRPDDLDLHRDVARSHLAFGRGIHYCVGARLARLEATIVLTEVLARTATIALDSARPPRWAESLLVRRLEELPVHLVPR
jgi:cytochrome P450